MNCPSPSHYLWIYLFINWISRGSVRNFRFSHRRKICFTRSEFEYLSKILLKKRRRKLFLYLEILKIEKFRNFLNHQNSDCFRNICNERTIYLSFSIPFVRDFFQLDLPPCSIHQSNALGETKSKMSISQ